MYRIDVSTALAVKPAYPAGGQGGFFAGCDGVNTFGTDLDHHWYNRVQEEITGVIEGAGIPLSAADDKQMFQAIVQLIIANQPPVISEAGQCYFQKSGGNLLLTPLNGNKLRVNGGIASIPDSGVAMSPAGLPANTSHFAYAYMTDDDMPQLSVEPSTTPYTLQAGTGIRVKSGDPSRTLVGLFRTTTEGTVVDTDKQRLVLSWFNRQPKPLLGILAANLSNPNSNAISADLHLDFMTWADAQVQLCGVGTVIANTVVCYVGVAVDGTVTRMTSSTSAQSSVANVVCPISLSSLSEGYHYADIASKAGAVTYQGDGSTYGDTYHTGFVMG